MGLGYDEITEQAAALPEPISLHGPRLVLHIQTSEQVVDDLLNLLSEMAAAKKAAGQTGPINDNDGEVYVRQ